MTASTLASHIAEGTRFMASPYRTGLHIGDIGDVPELPFSVICTGRSYLSCDEEKVGIATLVGRCALLEKASEIAQTYLKHAYFAFHIPVEYDPYNLRYFDPEELWVLNAQGEVIHIASASFIEGKWTLGRFKYPTGDLRKFTWLTRLYYY